MMDDVRRFDGAYPAVLDDGEGCIYGRTSRTRADACQDKSRKRVDQLEKKVDRLTWALVLAALAFTADLLRGVLLP